MKYLYLLIALLGSYILAGQSNTGPSSGKTLSWGIHVMPFSSLRVDYINSSPSVRVGVQAKSYNFSYLLDFEYGEDWFINRSNSPYVHYGLRPEIQYHYTHKDRGSYYLGLAFAFNYAEENVGRGNYRSTNGLRYRFDNGTLKKVKATATLKTGCFYKISERFYIDAYLGFGIGNRNIAYLHTVNKRISDIEPDEHGGVLPSPGTLKEGNARIGTVALGARIGYQLSPK